MGDCSFNEEFGFLARDEGALINFKGTAMEFPGPGNIRNWTPVKGLL